MSLKMTLTYLTRQETVWGPRPDFSKPQVSSGDLWTSQQPHSNVFLVNDPQKSEHIKKTTKMTTKKNLWSSHMVGVAENSSSISWVCSFLNSSMISSTWLSYSRRLLTRKAFPIFPSCCSRQWSRILSIVWNGSNWNNIIVRLTLKKWSFPMLCHVCFEHLIPL